MKPSSELPECPSPAHWLADIYDDNGAVLLRREWRLPECGKHFCDSCGDCLHCYGGDPCPYGHHWFVIYQEAP